MFLYLTFGQLTFFGGKLSCAPLACTYFVRAVFTPPQPPPHDVSRTSWRRTLESLSTFYPLPSINNLFISRRFQDLLRRTLESLASDRACFISKLDSEFRIRYSGFNIQDSIFNIQDSIFNIQYSIFNIQYSLQ